MIYKEPKRCANLNFWSNKFLTNMILVYYTLMLFSDVTNLDASEHSVMK